MNKTEIENLILLAVKGSAEASNCLGVYYATDGKNNAQAMKWYLRSASAGYAEGLWNAGSMLVDGIEKDTALGLLLIRLAADAFQTSACLYLSRCYQLGKFGLPIENELASFWDRMAYLPENFTGYSNSIELELINQNIVAKRFIDL